jgi:dipeptidyl aminopeptidase/acylaminoacyl peptidase
MRALVAALSTVLVLVLGACTEDLPDDPAPTETTPPPTVSPPDEPSTTPTTEPTEEPEALPAVNRPLSLPALMREEPSGGDVRVLRTELENDAYTRQQVDYRSGDRTVSGVLLRPRGRGPFPAVVLNHGYIDPAIYVTGQGLAREQDALARAGFVVLHTDYSGHATSDPVRPLERETRLAYTRDSANAVKALETLRYVDADRIGMLGRSMGGGVTMNVLAAYPGLVDAAISWSSVSSALDENIRHFTEPGRPDAALALYDRLGTPEEAPEVYAELSARTYFDRITEPVLVHHATTDETCPFRWARDTERLMRRAGVDSRLFVYDGEAHAFGPQWPLAMNRTIRFLREHLRA